MMGKEKHSNIFVLLNVVFTATLLISNVLATKQTELAPWLHSNGGMVTFPVTYILSDVFSEVYGYKASRRVTWMAFAISVYMALASQAAIRLPYPAWWGDQGAFAAVLGNTPRIVIASLLAFQLGDWGNDVIFQKLRRDYKGRGFGFRAIISSVIGVAIDSAIFFVIAFAGRMPVTALPATVLTGVLSKILYEIALLPVTVFIIKKLQNYEGEDAYRPAKSLGIFGGR
jgi:uncharacterized integral membrane protein (TIGR00697 family)